MNFWPVLVVFMPVLFVLLVWAVVTACRILSPEEMQPLVPDEAQVRAEETQRGRPIRVGAREIRADIRFQQRRHSARYCYDDHASDGLPEVWWDDVARRQN